MGTALKWIGAGGVIALVSWLVRWFLAYTDVEVSYNWGFGGTVNQPHSMRPNFDVRNRSRSRTYTLSNIAYFTSGGPHWFDNNSISGAALKPGTISQFNQVSPVPRVTTLQDCLELKVQLRLQNGAAVLCDGPSQRPGRFRGRAFALRRWLERNKIPLP